MVSPAHTEIAGLSRSASSFPTSHGDDLSTLDSTMSDDSDESVGFRMGRTSENAPFLPVSTLESVTVTPTSPVSPRRKEHFPPYIPSYSSALPSRHIGINCFLVFGPQVHSCHHHYHKVKYHLRRLPFYGIGFGWFLFILDFFIAVFPWYIGARIFLFVKHDVHERIGQMACTVANMAWAESNEAKDEQ